MLPKPRTLREKDLPSTLDDGDAELAAWLGERLRRVALGLVAALVAARAYWPSEPDLKAEAGTGLDWDLAMLLVCGLALAAALIGGRFRFRWSWTDAGVIALSALVGMSTSQAYDRRVAINLAWDWGAVGLAYLMVRILPRTRAESTALAGALVATAVALAAYGLYQAGVEIPQNQAFYRTHRAQVLANLGIAPGSHAAYMYELRLLGSNEPIATFALTNSLAGFLVGPLVVLLALAWENLVNPKGRTARAASLAMAVPLILALLTCLILTKSRSAWVGLAAALVVLAWRARRRVPTRTMVLTGLAGLLVVGAIVAAGLATRRLDRWVLTETTKSLGYRREYWIGAWRVITENSRSFWQGHGPGNFTAHYLRLKLPEASEEIFDPHDMVLDVWATAGLPAAVALVVGLGAAFWNLLGAGSSPAAVDDVAGANAAPVPGDEPARPPRRVVWLVLSAGAGWLLAVLLGHLNPFEGDLLSRWLILGAGWLGACALGVQLWRRLEIPPAALGAGGLAMAVNLLAAGGIGLPAVALMLWLLVALGLNLCTDRGCGRLREAGRVSAFGLALIWASLLGTFTTAIGSFWRSEAAVAEAEAALQARPPQFEKAEAAYLRAKDSDKFSARPLLGLAFEKYQEWEARGSRVDDQRWKTVPVFLLEAMKEPRNSKSWGLHRERARVMRQLLNELGSKIKPGELLTYRANIVEATRRAVQLYPSNPSLHADLALASAEIGMFGDAAKEARAALRYDALMPHLDKKLPPPLRKKLEDELPGWEEKAKQAHLETGPP